MKKIIALVCCLIFASSLAACGNNTTNDGTTSNGNTNGNGSSLQSTVDDLTNDVTQMTAKISADEAKAAALKHAGLTEAEVTGMDVDLDRDNGVLKYEIDFHHGGIEYDYDIDAESGNIISADKDAD